MYLLSDFYVHVRVQVCGSNSAVSVFYFVVIVKTPDQSFATPVFINSVQRVANTSEGPSPGKMREAV